MQLICLYVYSGTVHVHLHTTLAGVLHVSGHIQCEIAHVSTIQMENGHKLTKIDLHVECALVNLH